MKYILYSDLHIRPERQEDCLTALKQICDAALEHKAIVINGGDTFHTRGLIRTSCFDALWKEYHRWHQLGVTQYLVVGNHDQEDKAGEIHPMRAFEFDGWKVIEKPEAHDGIVFCPYIDKINEETIKEMESLVSRKKKFAVVHWGFLGAMMNDRIADLDGVPVEWMKNFEKVWSGHYHYKSVIENIQYIGSPIQHTFSEMGYDQGYWLWDKTKNKAEFFPITGTSKHVEVVKDLDSGTTAWSVPKKDIAARDFVRVVLKGDKTKVAAISKAEVQKFVGDCETIQIRREPEETDTSRLGIKKASITNTSELVTKYVDFVETELDKSKLKKMGLELLDASV